MAKNFLFVCGDIGGTNMIIPVAQKLKSLGHDVKFVADGEGLGYQTLMREKLGLEIQFESSDGLYHVPGGDTDLVFISTCASSNKVEKSYARAFRGVRPVVFGSDGFFNHSYKWRQDQADFWFAINEAHRKAILCLRPQLDSNQVKVVGQPAFDSLLNLIPRKSEIRERVRHQLWLNGENVFLWWSQGMPEVIEEDVEMVLKAIEKIGSVAFSPTFIPRVHPKLDKLKDGYVSEIKARIADSCRVYKVRCVDTDKISNEELCLAADVILSITATDDIKNWLMGGPPVVHLMGPKVRQWFEKDLLLEPPHYLPDVQSGEALAVTSGDEMDQVLRQALDPDIGRRLRQNWQPPQESATERVSQALLKLVS